MTRALLLACTGLAVVALCAPTVLHAPVHLVYNASDSVPRGWYRITDARSLWVGHIVLARLPADAAALAAQRGYLPRGVPILKRIGAVSPQEVCMQAQSVRIDGVSVATAMRTDGQDRSLRVWQQCRRLERGELFLLSMTNPASFDSRYFGPIVARDVIGNAQLVWTWDMP